MKRKKKKENYTSFSRAKNKIFSSVVKTTK